MYRLRSSWRLLLSGWLLGASLTLSKCYLCNMKGETATAKIKYIDTLEELMDSPDIDKERIGMKGVDFRATLDRSYTTGQAYEKYRKFLQDVARYNFKHGVPIYEVRRKTAYFTRSLSSARIRQTSTDCLNIYMGKMEYFPYTVQLFYSANLSMNIQDTMRYRVTRYVETKQLRPHDIDKEFKVGRVNETSSRVPLKPLTMTFLTPIFLVWFAGVAFSICAIAFEFVLPKRHDVRVQRYI